MQERQIDGCYGYFWLQVGMQRDCFDMCNADGCIGCAE